MGAWLVVGDIYFRIAVLGAVCWLLGYIIHVLFGRFGSAGEMPKGCSETSCSPASRSGQPRRSSPPLSLGLTFSLVSGVFAVRDMLASPGRR